MKPINLLPVELRPRRASDRLAGSSYFLVGGLFALLVLVGAYVLTSNQITSRENETAEALQQTHAAEAKSGSLGAFGDFASVAKTRIASVKQLAGGRLDWERLTRELAYVLPDDVWLTEMDASVTPAAETGGSAPSGASAGTAAATGPAMKLGGCAKSQPDVAKLMVRLRQLHGATDVKLQDSSKSETGPSAGAGDSSSGGGSDCGGNYKFELTVVLEPSAPVTAPTGSASKRVPARLGGGA